MFYLVRRNNPPKWVRQQMAAAKLKEEMEKEKSGAGEAGERRRRRMRTKMRTRRWCLWIGLGEEIGVRGVKRVVVEERGEWGLVIRCRLVV
jgi:hypothetical protein